MVTRKQIEAATDKLEKTKMAYYRELFNVKRGLSGKNLKNKSKAYNSASDKVKLLTLQYNEEQGITPKSQGEIWSESFRKDFPISRGSSEAFEQEKAAREYLTKLVKQQDLDDLEDALQVQESKRFKGYKDPTITVPKRKEAVRLIESDPSISPGNLEKALQVQESKRFKGYSKTQEDTSPSFDRDKDIFHQIAYGISKLTGQDPSVELIYPGDKRYGSSEEEDEMVKYLKKGGKVKKKKKSKKKYTSKKKYAMNRGGMASVRKPTRA